MKKAVEKLVKFIRDFYDKNLVPKPSPSFVDEQGQPLPPPTLEQRKQKFRQFITNKVAEGWTIEIENEFDIVLSKKPSFTWFGKLVIFLILLLLFAPLALFYLIVVIIRGVTAKPIRSHFRIDEMGLIHRR